jgi:hypothetical protein
MRDSRAMSGRPDVLDRNDELRALAVQQSHVLTRRQLTHCGVTSEAVADQLAARRWAEPLPGVVVLHRGPIIPSAREWMAAVLAGGPTVPRGRHVPAIRGVVVHEPRRHGAADIVLRKDRPTHTVERAAVDARSTW